MTALNYHLWHHHLFVLHCCFSTLLISGKTFAAGRDHPEQQRFFQACMTNPALTITKPSFQLQKAELNAHPVVQSDLKPLALPLALLLVFTGIRLRKPPRENADTTVADETNETPTFTVRAEGKEVQIVSDTVLFVRSLGNYIEIHTTHGKAITRECLYKFLETVPDPSAYLRIHRSVVVRLDKITGKTDQCVLIGTKELKVGNTYLEQISSLQLNN